MHRAEGQFLPVPSYGLREAPSTHYYMERIKGISRIKSDIVIHKTFVDGSDVLTWSDLHTTVASPVPVANWLHVEDGKITSLRVAFDARELAP